MQAGDDVDDTIADDQDVDPGSLLLQDAHPGPQVDDEGDQGGGEVDNKVNPGLSHIHLEIGFPHWIGLARWTPDCFPECAEMWSNCYHLPSARLDFPLMDLKHLAIRHYFQSDMIFLIIVLLLSNARIKIVPWQGIKWL